MSKLKFSATGLLLSAVLAVVTACGGGGGGDSPAAPPPAPKLGGVAAVGYPIVGAVIKVACASGPSLTSQPTSSDGSWQVNLSGQSFPCAVQVAGGTINNQANTTRYHAIALEDGVINVTPLTDLILANIVRAAVLSSWFDSLNAAILKSINASSVNTAIALVKTQLNLVQLGTSVNPMTTVFVPVPGNVMDDTLTAIRIALGNAGLSHATLVSQASSGDKFVAPMGFSNWIATSFVSTISGAKNSGTGNGTPLTGLNTTTGVAANGTPKFSRSGCSSNSFPGFYTVCGVSAIANFSNLTLVDDVDGKTCTASYKDGTLTATKSGVTISSFMDGLSMDPVTTFGSGTSETINSVQAMFVNGSVGIGMAFSNVVLQWDAAGTLKKIEGNTSTSVASSTSGSSKQSFSCSKK